MDQKKQGKGWQIGYKFEERVDQPLKKRKKKLPQHPTSFSFLTGRGLVHNQWRLIDSFFELTTNLPLSLN